MPQNLVTIRKTALGVLVELENSRQHIHQKLDKGNWERSIDTALSHSLKQLEGSEGADTGEVASLTREAELLKSNFNREAYREVLEQGKAGDAAMVQMLLTAQFDILTSLSDTMTMDEEDAVAHAKKIINRLLQTGYTAASQVVKPDGSIPVMEIFPPSRRGTPKRKKMVSVYARPIAQPVLAPAPVEPMSPTKGSPRRRKVMGAKKGISFTPVKKTRKGGVRWRDDETEEGTLADFEKTPQKFVSPSQPSPEKALVAPPIAAYLDEELEEEVEEVEIEEVEDEEEDMTEVTQVTEVTKEVTRELTKELKEPKEETKTINMESSPSLEIPRASSLAAKPSRFQAGFLSKGPRPSYAGGSPIPRAPSFSLNLASSSPEVQRTPPLRSLDVSKTGNLSPSPSQIAVPIRSLRSRPSIIDENNPLNNSFCSGSDSDSSTMDARKLRTAMHSAMKEKARRMSIMTGATASNARRISSMGSMNGDRPGPRPSLPALASSTNGISRLRRGSTERRRSPPLTCSPPDWKGDRALTPGQARRMNMGGNVRVENMGGSPRGGLAGDKARRITIGTGGAGHRRQESRGNTWR